VHQRPGDPHLRHAHDPRRTGAAAPPPPGGFFFDVQGPGVAVHLQTATVNATGRTGTVRRQTNTCQIPLGTNRPTPAPSNITKPRVEHQTDSTANLKHDRPVLQPRPGRLRRR